MYVTCKHFSLSFCWIFDPNTEDYFLYTREIQINNDSPSHFWYRRSASSLHKISNAIEDLVKKERKLPTYVA